MQMLACAGLIALPAAVSGQSIRWRSMDGIEVPVMTAAEAAQSLGALVNGTGVAHAVVQFTQPVDPTLRAVLGEAGVDLQAYLGDNAFFASVDEQRLDAGAIGRVGSLQLAQPIARQVKLHAMLIYLNDHPRAAKSSSCTAGMESKPAR